MMSEQSAGLHEELLAAAMESNEAFAAKLKTVMKQLGITSRELSEGSDTPLSTINKIVSQNRDLRCSTLRDIVKYIKSLELQNADIIIGIIGTRSALDGIKKHQLSIGGKKILLREYPASSIDDVIRGGIRAERERINGLVCVPIVANFIEGFVRVPIMTIKTGEGNVLDAVSLLVTKISSE